MSRLRDHIRDAINKSPDGITFAAFMEMALYDPEAGYYARPRAIGRGGDFYTSVSAGSCFGMLLARQIAAIHRDLNAGGDFLIVEQGGHDGQLAEDILRHLPEETGYTMVESVPAYVKAQQERLGERVKQVGHHGDISAEAGVFLCNELVDAFPVHRLQYLEGEWNELRVVLDSEGNFQERAFSFSPEDQSLRALIPDETPAEGHILEVCPAVEAWIQAVGGMFRNGIAIIIDYGMAESDLLEPSRKDGTLRCFREHRATDDPFEEIGNTDITFQVNFTHLERAAEAAGWRVLGNTDQSRFLTGIAADWLQEIEGQGPTAETAALVKQFQTLTHPGNMGRVFRVLVLGKGEVPAQLDGLKWCRA